QKTTVKLRAAADEIARHYDLVYSTRHRWQRERFLYEQFHASPMATVCLNVDEQVTMWNPAAERLFGWTREQAIGRHLPFLPENSGDALSTFLRCAFAGEQIAARELSGQRWDGQAIDISLSVAPLFNEGGDIEQ